jgi:hypothetical protein
LSSSVRASGVKSLLRGSKSQGHRTLKRGGLAYQIDFAAADPTLYIPAGTSPPMPEVYNVDGKLIVERGDGSIPDAKFNKALSSGPSGNVKVESLMPEDLYLGQIVPFEIKISVSGLEDPDDDKIRFTAGWSTETTSKGEFGYDFQTYGVLAAFVDTADGAHIDPGMNALVTNFTWSHVTDANNHGNEIQGVFDVEGLNDGDEVVIEVWVVIQSTFPTKATGNVHSRLIDARTLRSASTINTGTQTVPMMKVQAGVGDGGFTEPNEQQRTSSSSSSTSSSTSDTAAEEMQYLCL